MKRIALVFALLLAAGLLWLATRDGDGRPAIVASDVATGSGPDGEPQPTPLAEARESASPASDSSRETAAPIEVDSRLPHRRAVRARLLDDRTHESIPFLALLVGEDSRIEHLVSNAEGIVSGTIERERRTIELALADEPGELDRIQVRRREVGSLPSKFSFEHDPAIELVDIAIPIGPTYRLRIALPPAYSLGDLGASLRAADPRQAFDVVFADVSEGDPPWTRFRATARLLEGGPPWKLELATRDGLWVGSAEVASREGIHHGVLDVVLEARARLTGRVLDGDGAPVPDHFVRLDPPNADFDDPANRPLVGVTDDDGRFDVGRIRPGSYELWTDHERHEKFTEHLDLAPGETRAVEIELVPVADSHERIEVRVESRTGRFEQRVYAALRTVDPDTRDEFGDEVVWRDEGGRKVGRVAFENLRAGRYRLRLTAHGAHDVDPRELVLSTSDAAPTCVVEDGGERARLVITVVDEADSPLEGAIVSLEFDTPRGPFWRGVSATGGRAEIESLPVGAACRYRVHLSDHQPVWGEIVPRAGDVDELVTVRLKRGWGADVFTFDEDRKPVARVRILLDGELVGTTDELGRLRVTTEKVPSTARAELPGWTTTAESNADPLDGRFRVWDFELSFVLARNE